MWMVTLGRLQSQIVDVNQLFTFKVWIKISLQDIERLTQENHDFECDGELLDDVPFYQYGKGEMVYVKFDTDRANFHEPSLRVKSSSHEFYLHQEYGIPKAKFLEWMRSLEAGEAPIA